MPSYRQFIIIGSTFALIAVLLGAFGAHALKEGLVANGTLEVWKTAVNYQMWHAVALILCGFLQNNSATYRLSAALFGFGIISFSGSLYWLALGGPKWLGPVTPLGGICFILGWLLVIVTQLKQSKHHSD